MDRSKMPLQRKCACGKNSGTSGQCEECGRQSPGATIQRSATAPAANDFAPRLVHEVLRSSGQSLDQSNRTSMESRFGHDFSHVRIHVDDRAAQSAQAVNALAYTVGRDIVFGGGQYTPASSQGQKLLAHELTHVIQQDVTSAAIQTAGIHIAGNDRSEREAEAAASGIAAGEQVRVSAGGIAQSIQRWPWPWPIGGQNGEANDCPGYEQDPQSLSIEVAKHFLDDKQPGVGSRLVRTTDCQVQQNSNRIECDVTFDDGEVIRVSIESKLHNVEGQRPTATGREWCVYHFTCDANGVLNFQTKGCGADYNTVPPLQSGPTLVGSRSGAPGRSASKTA
jgi:hypothetical protein